MAADERRCIEDARAAGASWREIGAALGLNSRQEAPAASRLAARKEPTMTQVVITTYGTLHGPAPIED